MSLAVLARKTKTKRRMKSNKKGFILNMTGRGHVIGQSAKYSGCRQCGRQSWRPHGSTCKCAGSSNGVRQNCCQADKIVSYECRGKCAARWFQGLSQPAPQMGYGVYNNRISGGGYYPGNTIHGGRTGRIGPRGGPKSKRRPGLPVWKQMPNYSASTIIAKNKAATLNQNRHIALKAPISACKARKDASGNIVHLPGCCNPEGKNVQPHGCCRGVKIKPRLGYTRINHGWCQSTKGNPIGLPASYQIDRNKARAMDCICNTGFECCGNGCGSGYTCCRGDTTLQIISSQTEPDPYLMMLTGPTILNRCGTYTIDGSQFTGSFLVVLTINPQKIFDADGEIPDYIEDHRNKCKILWRGDDAIKKGTFRIPPSKCFPESSVFIVPGDSQGAPGDAAPLKVNIAPCEPGLSFKLPMSNKCGRVGV